VLRNSTTSPATARATAEAAADHARICGPVAEAAHSRSCGSGKAFVPALSGLGLREGKRAYGAKPVGLLVSESARNGGSIIFNNTKAVNSPNLV
jgi:hypothetical protein